MDQGATDGSWTDQGEIEEAMDQGAMKRVMDVISDESGIKL